MPNSLCRFFINFQVVTCQPIISGVENNDQTIELKSKTEKPKSKINRKKIICGELKKKLIENP